MRILALLIGNTFSSSFIISRAYFFALCFSMILILQSVIAFRIVFRGNARRSLALTDISTIMWATSFFKLSIIWSLSRSVSWYSPLFRISMNISSTVNLLPKTFRSSILAFLPAVAFE